MSLEISLIILGMLGTSLITVAGVLLGYHNYLMREISKRLKKENYYRDKESFDRKFEEIKESSEKQNDEIKEMINRLREKVDTDNKKIYDYLINFRNEK